MQFYGKCSVLTMVDTLSVAVYRQMCAWINANLNKHCVTLPMINKTNCRPFALEVLLPKKWYFEPFWRILSLLFTVPLSRKTRA